MVVLPRIFRLLGITAAISSLAVVANHPNWTEPSSAHSQDNSKAVVIAMSKNDIGSNATPSQTDWPESIASEEQSLDLHTTGIQKALQGNYESAIDDYNRALRLSPYNPEIYYNRAVAYYSIGGATQALQNFDHAIQLQPTMAEAYANRGTIRLEVGDIEGALADGKKAAELFEQQGKLQLAAQMWDWVQQHTPLSSLR